MAADVVPDRIAWAVQVLSLSGEEDVLELGCGPGMAVAEVGRRLSSGRVTAIDRSEVAVSRASRRNADLVAAGTADVQRLAVEELPAGLDGRTFDVVFAVNVNLFWTQDAGRELAALRSLLVAGGWLRLFYEAPDSARADEIRAQVADAMTRAGLTDVAVDRPSPSFVGVSGRRV